MQKELTELIFILDKSGSMCGLEDDTIGGFNSMLEKQREEGGDCIITTALFDTQYQIIHERADIRSVSPMTKEDYRPGGGTALLDAVGLTIHRAGTTQMLMAPNRRSKKVMVVIITDGMENASTHYTYGGIKMRIERQKEKYGWEFIFLGANIDAAAEGERIGIARNRAHRFHCDPSGVETNFRSVCNVVSRYSRGEGIDEDWAKEIDELYSKKEEN